MKAWQYMSVASRIAWITSLKEEPHHYDELGLWQGWLCLSHNFSSREIFAKVSLRSHGHIIKAVKWAASVTCIHIPCHSADSGGLLMHFALTTTWRENCQSNQSTRLHVLMGKDITRIFLSPNLHETSPESGSELISTYERKEKIPFYMKKHYHQPYNSPLTYCTPFAKLIKTKN